jgi:hypothetical protein
MENNRDLEATCCSVVIDGRVRRIPFADPEPDEIEAIASLGNRGLAQSLIPPVPAILPPLARSP